ncbi:MAG: putative rane protein [Bacillales bacterium]|jgi:uncharacterized membrane protein YraQ (UPF0718 family)|nr:putative rane protein [Bacillales bacterium]
MKIAGLIKRYKLFLLIFFINVFTLLFFPKVGAQSIKISWKNILEMLSVIPPIFVLLGLLDVWIKRETMMKYMGDGSGLIGVLIAFFLGSAAAGPLYAAFPVAGILLKKGSKLSNVLVFIGAWSTTKIPLLLFEASSLGTTFTLLRLFINVIGIAVIALLTDVLLSKSEKEEIVHLAIARD